MSTTKQCLIVGGKGYLGQKIHHTCLKNNIESHDSNKQELNLNETHTYDFINAFETIIICCESRIENKIAFIEAALEKGKYIIESSADPNVIHALIQHFNQKQIKKGSLLVGMGVFPGLSNIILADKIKHNPQAQWSITVSTSPFAGAGNHMCELMLDLLQSEHAEFNKVFKAFHFKFPENAMLTQSQNYTKLKTYYRTAPHFLNPVLQLLIKSNVLSMAIIRKFMLFSIKTLRQKLFIKKPSPINIWITANNINPNTSKANYQFKDGIALACHCILYAVLNKNNTVGMHMPDQLFEKKSIVNHLQSKKLL